MQTSKTGNLCARDKTSEILSVTSNLLPGSVVREFKINITLPGGQSTRFDSQHYFQLRHDVQIIPFNCSTIVVTDSISASWILPQDLVNTDQILLPLSYLDAWAEKWDIIGIA